MTYELIDSGDYKKLEQIGSFRIIRPSPQASWPIHNKKLWQDVDDTYLRNNKGGGKWQKNALPSKFNITYNNFDLIIKPTNFGHLGIFAEQKDNWQYLQSFSQKDLQIINLFAYTGIASMAAQRSNAKVSNLDAAKNITHWAKDNATLNNISNIRYLVEDVRKFIKKEIKRNKVYDGFILDPPSYGRGSQNEIWDIKKDLIPLLYDIKKLLSDNRKYIILSCHSPHFSCKVLENILISIFGNQQIESFEMIIKEKNSSRVLPSGTCARLIFK